MKNYVQIAKNPFPIHEYAALVPLATEPEQIALTHDIRENGQREPIVIWKGQVVDGRCRQKALLLLKRDIIFKELDDSLSDEEVKLFVKSVNTRRNLTITQKLIIAAKEHLSTKKSTIKKQAIAWGVSTSSLDNTLWLIRNQPDIIEPLFNGFGIEIKDQKGNEYSSNKITAIYAYYKKRIEKVVENKEHAWNPNSHIKTITGKQWYKNIIENKNELEIKMALVELANYKFPINKKGK
jgi:hypothetical protein